MLKSAPATARHTLHVKSWGSGGAVCVASVGINVVPPATSAVPSNANVVGRIQSLVNWQAVSDTASGGGQAWGTTQIVGAPSASGVGRQFVSHYSNYSGERYFVSFGADTYATNFLYDAWVYLAGSNNISNIEMDMNQVMPQWTDRDLRRPMRRLLEHVGLHGQCRKPLESK